MGTQGEAAAERVTAVMAKLIATVEALDEAAVHRMPGEGEWSAMETLAHVAEMTSFWAHRARLVADGALGDRPYDRTPEENALRSAAVADHGQDSLRSMVEWLRSSARDAADVLREIPDERWSRSALWASQQCRHTVSELVEERILSHVRAHIEQAASAAAQ